jgi:hypothetical protein
MKISKNCSVYTADEEPPAPPVPQKKRDRDRTYEVTTTTESFHRTIHPPEERVVYPGDPEYPVQRDY